MTEDRYTVFSDDLDEEEEFVEESGELISSENNESFHYDPIKVTPTYHIEQGEKALEKLKFVVEESGWKKALTAKTSTVYSKSGIGDNDKAPVFMCEHIIENFTPQSIFAVVGMRKLWDPWYEEGNLVENLDDTTSLTYMVMQGVAGTRTRDLSLVEKIQCDQDGTIYFASTSVETNKVPQVVDRIRAYLLLNGWIIKPVASNPPRTKITYVLQAKVNGWIPSVVVKKYLLKRPLVVHIIDQYLQKNGPPPMVISTSPPVSNRPSRSTSNASSNYPSNSIKKNNHIDWADQRRYRANGNKEFQKRPATFSSKQIIAYSPLNRVTSMQSSTREIKEISDDKDSSQSSQVTLEAHEKHPSLGTPTSPKPNQFPLPPSSPSSLSSLNKEFTSVQNQPIDPIMPIQAQPTNPIQPTKAVQPTNPIQPTKAVQPTNPIQPTKAVQPTNPIQPTKAVQPTNPIQPTKAVQPTNPIQPIKPVHPITKPFIPPPPPMKHRFTEAVNIAVATFKDNVKTLEGWSYYMESKGVKIYTKDVTSRSTPIIRGDYTLSGSYTADDFLAVIKNLDLRKFWDDRYEDGKNIEIFDNDEILSRVSMKGIFPISGRDFVLCGTVVRGPETGRIWFVTTSVTDPVIPEVKKYVRGHVNFTGWQIDPKFDLNGNIEALDIVYIVDTDIKLESVPYSILKSISTGTPMVIKKIDEMLQTTGFPPYIINSSSLIISESLNPKNFQYDLSFVVKNNAVTDIRFSKIMYPNGCNIYITPKNTKVELLSNDSEIVRITAPSGALTDRIQIKITKHTNGFKMTYNGNNDIPLAQKTVESKPSVESLTRIEPLPNVESLPRTEPLPKVESLTRIEPLPKVESLPRVEPLPKVESLPMIEPLPNVESLPSVESLTRIEPLPKVESLLTENIFTTTNYSSVKSAQPILRSVELPIEKETIKLSQNQRHSRKLSQPIDPNSTLVADETFDGDIFVNKNNEQDNHAPRKQKRLSFANSPSIINSETFFKPKEENNISEFEAKPADNGYNELEEYEEIIKTFNENPIEHNAYDISKDIIIISENVKFNSYQAGIMFVAMMLSYYSGKLSCYFS